MLPGPAAAETVPVRASVISAFKYGSTETVFGALEFLSGIELTSTNALLGAMSSIRFRPDGVHFIAVLDTGHFAEGAVTRDAEGRLAGVGDLTVTSMKDRQGHDEQVKWKMDAEGLALRPGEVLVSYERDDRIDIYPDPGFTASGPVGGLPILIPEGALNGNRGLETLAVSPADSPLRGGAVTVAELSYDAKGNLLAAILDGPRKGLFAVREIKPFAVTDGAFLPDGDLLLLERRFSFAEGVGMQIRRIPADSLRPGAVVDGEVLINVDMSHQIDNMEGMDVVAGPDGETRIILVSDDNHSILQRTLMLEFRLKR
ncbi:esterase-like activity of phytase family protein [Ensifer soli]|uniref:esterase-like activity of phytase family protein n=1 Tax=Ciceribacter sp. sgz301302 TaxID=3342379 RepID=UPI0035BB9A1F